MWTRIERSYTRLNGYREHWHFAKSADRSQSQLVFRIHIEHDHCGAAHVGLSGQNNTIPRKMLFPLLLTGMKQPSKLTCCRVDAGQIRAFVQIAVDARQSQVVFAVGTAMLCGDDVLDMKSGQR